MGETAEQVVGRPPRRAAICDAAFDLLGEVGYERMSMDAVAARARVSKATIYRVWPHKADLVIDALAHRLGGEPAPPGTGSLRGDLEALMSRACRAAESEAGAVVTGLLSAAAHNPELSSALYRCTYQLKHPVHEAIVRAAADRGEIPAGTDPDLLHELLHALVLTRRMAAVGPLDDAFVRHAVDDILLPVLCRGPVPAG